MVAFRHGRISININPTMECEFDINQFDPLPNEKLDKSSYVVTTIEKTSGGKLLVYGYKSGLIPDGNSSDLQIREFLIVINGDDTHHLCYSFLSRSSATIIPLTKDGFSYTFKYYFDIGEKIVDLGSTLAMQGTRNNLKKENQGDTAGVLFIDVKSGAIANFYDAKAVQTGSGKKDSGLDILSLRGTSLGEVIVTERFWVHILNNKGERRAEPVSILAALNNPIVFESGTIALSNSTGTIVFVDRNGKQSWPNLENYAFDDRFRLIDNEDENGFYPIKTNKNTMAIGTKTGELIFISEDGSYAVYNPKFKSVFPPVLDAKGNLVIGSGQNLLLFPPTILQKN